MASQNNNSKFSMIEMFLRYLTRTRPAILFLHLLWIIITCCVLSSTYIFAFHFPSLIRIYEDAHNIRNFNANLKLSAKQDQEINKELQDLLGKTKANRAYVFRYHNGLAAVNGVPFFFQTNTHEVIAPGTSRVIQFEQHVPASINISMNNQFMNNQCIVITDIEKDKDNQNYYFFQVRGARSVIRCPIFMNNGDLFGYVGIDFLTNINKKALNDIDDIVELTALNLTKIFSLNSK